MNDSKLEVIRKLLAKAERGATQEERDAYTAKATELIAKYGIDEMLLNAQSATRSTVGNRMIVIEPDYAKDKVSFFNHIYQPLGCKVVQLGQDRTTRNITLHVFGYDSDLDRAEIMYTSLLIQVLAEMSKVPSAGHQRTTAANRRAVMAGFGRAVYHRLNAAESDAAESVESEGVSTALVLVDRQSAVASAQEDIYPSLRKAPKRTLSGHGYSRGYAAGERADIGQKRVGNSRAMINS